LKIALAEARVKNERGRLTTRAVFELGNAHFEEGRYDNALRLWKHVSQCVDHSHPSLAATYLSIGEVYVEQAKYNDAFIMCDRAMKIIITVHPPRPALLASAYNSLGTVHNHQERYTEALAMYISSIKINIKLHGANHPELACTYSNIGIVYYKQCKYTQALRMYDKALVVDERIYGTHHPNVAKTYLKYAETVAANFLLKAVFAALAWFGKDKEISKPHLRFITRHCLFSRAFMAKGTLWLQMSSTRLQQTTACNRTQKRHLLH